MDFTLVLALVLASVAVFVLSLVYVLLPLAKAQQAQTALQAAGGRVVPSAAEPASDGMSPMSGWAVPAPAATIQEAVASAVSTKPGAAVTRAEASRLSLAGRSARFWNVNNVDPLDFAKAEVAFQNDSPNQTTVNVRVDFSGYWRAILTVGLFTSFGGFILWMTSPYREGSLKLAMVVLALGIFFLCVRYYAQRQRTRAFFDRLVLDALRRSPSSRPTA